MSWPTVSLAEVAEVIRGVSFSKSEGVNIPKDNSLPVLRAGNIQQKLLLTDGLIWVSDNKIKEKQLIKKNDIIMCTSSGSSNLVGKSAISTEDWNGSFGAFCVGIRAIESKCSPAYLYHFLQTPHFKNWTNLSSGSNIKNIRISELLNFEIPLPSQKEQKRIAAILDKADAVRRKRQQAIKLSEQLLRSVFLDMFGDPMANPYDWPYKNLKELISNGPQNGLYEPSSKYGSGTPIVRIDSFYHGNIENIDNLKRVRTDESNIARYKLQKDDILINRVNSRSHLGKCALITHLNEPTIFESNMMRFSIDKSQINVYYFITILQHQFVKQQILGRCKDSVNQSSINQEDVNSICFPLPPIALQEKFGELHKKISTFKSKLEEDKKGIEDILNALTQKAFRGELCKQLDSELA